MFFLIRKQSWKTFWLKYCYGVVQLILIDFAQALYYLCEIGLIDWATNMGKGNKVKGRGKALWLMLSKREGEFLHRRLIIF